jgi:aspartate/methionine/tyrosine aminotransferase
MALRLEDVSRQVRQTEYAVRGPIVARAQELERAGREIIFCNIGNPQALGQRPVTYVRQLLALMEYPDLLERVPPGTFPQDVVETARHLLDHASHGLGVYTESKGFRFVREAVAAFIRQRDGIEADAEAIFLTDGASKGVQSVLRMLIGDARDGILIPTPQYPLYSATIALYGGAAIPYELDEAADWSLSRATMEAAVARAKAAGLRPRAVVVINPGNPTGAVLDEQNVAMVLAFAQEHGLAVLADEVYQENVYRSRDRFVSFAAVLEHRGYRDVSLFSFHSTSKGYLGECGHRGGYLECRGVPADVLAEVTKLQSVALCANTAGQIVTYCLVHPPRPGSPSFELWDRERRTILDALARKAELVGTALAGVEGIRCNPVAGAMYAFPRLELPPGVTDFDYCLALLEETGICVVDGTGFGQAEGTWHLRTTILPPLDQIETVVRRLAQFHERFTRARRAPGSDR